MPRFVIFSDPHIHPWAAFSHGDGAANSRLLRSLEVLEASLRRAREDGIPWLFAGDLVHTAGYALNPVMSGVVEALAKYPDVGKVAVWGNHDARGVGGKITLEQTVFPALLRAVPNFTVLNGEPSPGTSEVFEHKGLTVAGSGYQPRADLLSYPPPADVGIFHQTVRGSRTADGFELREGIDRQELLSRYQVSIVGHVHHPQEIRQDDRLIMVPGSPEHNNFGDKGEHGWWVLNTDDVTAEFIPGGSPLFITVERREEVKDNGHFYRVRSGAGTQGILPDNAVAIAASPTIVTQRDLLKDAHGPEEILQIWMREYPPENEDAAALETFLTAGMQILKAQDPTKLRPVRLKSLSLQNFLSYEAQEFPIPAGVFLVTGEGRDFPSNGAGKSSVIGEAAYWLVHGDNTKGLAADEVIRWGSTECSVAGVFHEQRILGDDSAVSVIEVCRTRTAAGAHTLSVSTDGQPWEATGVREMTDKLRKYLGLTPEIDRNLRYWSQEQLLLFSSATDGDRKGVLSDLLGLSAYQSAATSAGESASAVASKRDEVLAVVKTREGDLEQARNILSQVEERSLTWEEKNRRIISSTEAELQSLKDADPTPWLRQREAKVLERLASSTYRTDFVKTLHQRKVDETFKRLARESTARLDEVQKKIEAHEARLAQTWSAVSTFQGLVGNLPGLREKTEEAGKVLARLRTDEQEARTVSTKAQVAHKAITAQAEQEVRETARWEEALNAGTCPTCLQAVSPEHIETCVAPQKEKIQKFQEVLAQLEVELSTAETGLEAAQLEVRLAAEKHEGLRERVQRIEADEHFLRETESLRDEERRLNAAVKNIMAEAQSTADAWEKQTIQAIEKRFEDRRRRVRRFVQNAVEEYARKLEIAETGLSHARSRENPHEEHLKSAREHVATVERSLKDSQTEVDRLSQQVGVYQYWKKGFGRQGIQSLLMEEIAAIFNRIRGDVFPVLTQGVYDVQFSTLSQTAGGELRERTRFQVFMRGEEIPYGSTSGGQRRRIDVGVMLVMVRAVSEWMGVPGVLGMLVLDEVLSFVDSSGAEGLVEVLNEVQKQIPTIFVVTQDPQLQSMFPNTLHVRQDEDGTSHLVLGDSAA